MVHESLGNELAFQQSENGVVGPGFARYLADGSRAVRKLDNTRLVGLDRHSRIGEPTSAVTSRAGQDNGEDASRENNSQVAP